MGFISSSVSCHLRLFRGHVNICPVHCLPAVTPETSASLRVQPPHTGSGAASPPLRLLCDALVHPATPPTFAPVPPRLSCMSMCVCVCVC